MATIIKIEPNEWVSEDLLMAITGMKRGTITRARKFSWLLGREYKHVSPEGDPKPTNECMYNRKAVDAWIHAQKPLGDRAL
ncbi:excisionase [Raoultella sp. Lac2]|uniref:excisionase family protein n=1 Tax=unclassified Raoultella TaxID=2627600 RepID=UPI0013547B1D|nr:excisionase [Raoultella sp. Lac2]MXF99369.1 excisionase [Raoultella sp. Lac1]